MIDLTNVSKVYNSNTSNQVEALKKVNFQVRRGEFIAITGPSGSGKSTLLHILAGLDDITSGCYLFQGADVSRLSDREKCKLRNKKIAVILQSFGLLGNESVLKNVCLPSVIGGSYNKDTKKCALKILKEVGLEGVGDKMVNQLSGGQCQRVAIARALMMDADILLADEPTGALDTENTSALVDILADLNQKGLTVIIVTHNAAVAERCPTVYSIVDGVLSRIR